MEGQSQGHTHWRRTHTPFHDGCVNVNPTYFRKSCSIRCTQIFCLFLGLAMIPLLGVGGVDGGPVLVKRSTCSHDLIMSFYSTTCKGKRSHEQKLVGGGGQGAERSVALEEKEVLEILSNSLTLYETWTNHGKREEDSTTTTPIIKPWKSVHKKEKESRRWRKAVAAPKEEPNYSQNEVEMEADAEEEEILSPKLSISDAKMLQWMEARLGREEGVGEGEGRLRRDHGQVMQAIINCCKGGCIASDFKC